MNVCLTALCLQTLWQNSFHVIPQQTKKCKPVRWSNCLMATWRCCEKIDLQASWQPCKITTATGKQNKLRKIARDEMPKNSQEWLSAFLGKPKSEIQKQRLLPTWEFSTVPLSSSYHFLPTFLFHSSTHCWQIGAAGMFLLATWPFTNSYNILFFFQWHRNHNQNSELKAVERVFLPWKACLSGAIRNCWEGKSLALHVPNSLLQCHFHEQKDLPRKPWIGKRNYSSESSKKVPDKFLTLLGEKGS